MPARIGSPHHLKPFNDRSHQKRDRVKHVCPNCGATAYARPDMPLVCGLCFIPMDEVWPEGFPKCPRNGSYKIANPTVKPAEIPLDQLALPKQVRALIDDITVEHEPKEEATPESGHQKRRRQRLEWQRKVRLRDRIRVLLSDPNAKRGWKKALAKEFDLDPAVISRQVKVVQQEVAA